MTTRLFMDDAYLKTAPATVMRHTDEGGVVLDATILYARSGGQPGDSGVLHWPGGRLPIATSVKGDGDEIVLIPSEPMALPDVGMQIEQHLQWDRRFAHMRIHTALHLLSVVVPLPVTGGAITAEKGRLDFDMPEAPDDKDALEYELNKLIQDDLEITESWITDDELRANPGLIKTMSVMPPMGAGRVRLVRIGTAERQIDLQPCGGTHVARTSEIGPVTLGKIEKKGRQNRRMSVILAP
ncbi:MAG: misacylated tRNA(Ala) deacylase [Paracoccaceae bacterium]|jgi:misacylated tRNA(Ala) deacylase